MPVEVLDFSRSFITWTRKPRPGDFHSTWGNSVRINLEARLRVFNETGDASEDFVLGALCRSERMYRNEGHFIMPGSDYLMAFASDRCLRFSPDISAPQAAPEIDSFIDLLTSLDFKMTSMRAPRRLATEAEVAEIAETQSPVVVKTEIRNSESGRRAVLEYPVKTLNHNREHQRFQVDTGPVLWADLAAVEPDPIMSIRLAHVVFNRFDQAEFAKRAPTVLKKDGGEPFSIEDYREFSVHEARHEFFIDGLDG